MGEGRKEMSGGGTQSSLLLNFRLSSTFHLNARETGKFISIYCTTNSIPNKYFSCMPSEHFFRLIQIMTRFICDLQTLPHTFYLHCCIIINPLKLAKTMAKQKFSLRSPTSQRGLIMSVPVLCNFKATSLILPGNNFFRAEVFERVQTSSLSETATNNPGETLRVFSRGWDGLFFLMALSCIL